MQKGRGIAIAGLSVGIVALVTALIAVVLSAVGIKSGSRR